jgi:uncharacterized protein YycO
MVYWAQSRLNFVIRIRQAAFLCSVALLIIALLRGFGRETKLDASATLKPSNCSPGDVIFFRTITWCGRIVRLLEYNGDNFTHVGVVVRCTAGIYVAHASPAGPALARVDRLSDLLSSNEITSFSVYRPRASDHALVRAARIAQSYADRKVPFDFDFELGDDKKIYCTELVWLAYRAAGLRNTSRGILFPDDLLRTNFFMRLLEAN